MSTRLACVATLIWLLNGCTALPPAATSPNAIEAASSRTYTETIDLAGRLSIQYRRDASDESLHGNFTWSQTPQLTQLSLLSPLGQTLAVIEMQAGSASLTQAGKPTTTAADADSLAQNVLGWPLPIAGLRDWLQGFAQNAQGQRWIAPTIDGSSVTTPDGWQLTYASWQQDSPDTPARPRRIDLARQTTEAGPVSLRIVIDNWHTPVKPKQP